MKLSELETLVSLLKAQKLIPDPEVTFSIQPEDRYTLVVDDLLNCITNEGDYRIRMKAQ